MKGSRVNYKCIRCNRPFSVTIESLKQLNERGVVPNPLCSFCQKVIATKKDHVKFTCIKCGKSFTRAPNDIKRVTKAGLKPNPMCLDCQRDIMSRNVKKAEGGVET